MDTTKTPLFNKQSWMTVGNDAPDLKAKTLSEQSIGNDKWKEVAQETFKADFSDINPNLKWPRDN